MARYPRDEATISLLGDQKQLEDQTATKEGVKATSVAPRHGSEWDDPNTHNRWSRLLMSLGLRQRKGARRSSLQVSRPFDNEDKLARLQSVRPSRILVRIPIVLLCIFGVIHLFNVLFSLGPWIWDDRAEEFLPHWGQPGQPGEGLSRYLTDFTRDVVPIPCHSHNDYWRRIPLYEAIHYGCTGVEADVWLFDGELYVGHNTASLTRNRTFRNLYVDPLVGILDRMNQNNEFGITEGHGVFDEDEHQTLTLLVDFKNSGKDTWAYVQRQLEPLRSRGYLTSFNGTATAPGPVTVVATGNAPFDSVIADKEHRDIFFDAPLADMYEAPSTDNTGEQHTAAVAPARPSRTVYSMFARSALGGQGHAGTSSISGPDAFGSANSYYASASFMHTVGFPIWGRLSADQIETIRGLIRGAHKRGLKARFWETPSWPISLRNHIWDVLVEEGADYLNVDDLKAASKEDWGRKKHRPFF